MNLSNPAQAVRHTVCGKQGHRGAVGRALTLGVHETNADVSSTIPQPSGPSESHFLL